jgi:hypothetical protein
MTTQGPMFPPQVPTPQGVLAGTKAIAAVSGGRGMLTPERVRQLSGSEHDDLTAPNIEGENGYNDPVDPGLNPWDIFSRTYIKNVDEAKEIAVALALQIPRLRNDPAWAEAPFIGMPIMAAAYQIEMVLRKSVGRLSLIEAVMTKVGMFSPDSFSDMIKAVGEKRGKR